MMDSVSLMWAFILVLPVILTMALCIGCRERAPTQISQSVDDYDFKPSYMSHSHTSFTVIRNPSTGMPNNFPSSLPVATSEVFLSVPCSPQAPESRRSSFTPAEVDNESVPSYENEDQKQPEDEDYINDTYISGYIDVLPDNVETPASDPEPAHELEPAGDMHSGRLSSTNTEEYENVVEQQRDSMGDSLEYVNVPEQHQVEQRSENLSFDGGSNQDSEDDTPDYENVTKKSRD
uniref:Linker for activation of T-cells family member 1 n=1 Tax=Geotrypetes seraphini TaxID=260995 RepID=A0A6P8QN41_GEOSA|nr:linker for activation of T-cells family member 1 [Geotrypetes seraphini]